MPDATTDVFSFHLVQMPVAATTSLLIAPPRAGTVAGLQHAECLALMRLGAPVVSPDRMQLRRVAMFARWDSESSIDDFLGAGRRGARFASGWHVRMNYLRRWSQTKAFNDLPPRTGEWDLDEPVVAVTLARMRMPEVPRFRHWGRPVERQVRDDPGATLACAAMRPPHTISTFSIWRTMRAMTEMVHGHSALPDPSRHRDAMVERARRDFHHEFATYRFRPISEHGTWEGRSGFIPDV